MVRPRIRYNFNEILRATNRFEQLRIILQNTNIEEKRQSLETFIQEETAYLEQYPNPEGHSSLLNDANHHMALIIQNELVEYHETCGFYSR
ncbi:MAG: hypothetical protein WC627_10690 [Legionella sp.]|jgi:hypothetical protein